MHFSPFQNAELRMDNFDLVLILPFTPSGNSDDYFEQDFLGSRTGLVMHVRDSVPTRSYDGSFFV